MSKLDLGLRIVQMLAELGIKPATFLGKASNVKKAFTGGKPTFFKPDVLETFRAQDGNFSDALKLMEDEAKYIVNATDAEKMAFLNNLSQYKSLGGPPKSTGGITSTNAMEQFRKTQSELQKALKDLQSTTEKNKNQALKDLDDFMETGGQPFKKKDNKFLGGSMHEEGQLRTGIRQFLQTEFKNGRLKLDELDKERVMQYSPMIEHDPILVFKKIYGEDAFNKAGSFPGAFEKGENFKHYEQIFRENMGNDVLKVKNEKYKGDGKLVLTEQEEVFTPTPDDPDIPFAKGGIAGYYTGGMVDVEPNLSDIGHGSDALMARTRLVSPDGQATTSTGLNYLLAEDNDNIRVPFGSGKKVYDYNSFEHKINELNAHYKRYKKQGGTIPFEIFSEAFAKENFAEGGRIGFAGGGSDRMMSDAEKEERAYNLMRDAMDREKFLKRRREEMEMDKKRLEEKKYGVAVAQGGRIGFSKGKAVKAVVDKGRRGFMKAAGAGAAGLAALKTGLLGFGKEAAPVVEKAAETVSNTMGEAPAYFLNLVKKIKNLGSEYSPKYSGGREKITNYKDYTLTEDLTTGETTIQRFKQSEVDYYDEMLMEENYMNYRPGMADETTKGKTPPGEYTEDTGYLRTSGPSKGDVIIEGEPIPKDIIEEGTMFEDNMTEFGKTKKADGGRIGFESGKIVLGKKIYDLLKNNKKIREAVDNIFKSGDYKYDAEIAAESLVELNPKAFGNKLYEDLDEKTRMEIYGAVLPEVRGGSKIKPYDNPISDTSTKRVFKGVEIKDPTFDETLPFDNDAEKLAEIKMSNEAYDMEIAQSKKLAPQMTERLELKQKYPGITDDLLDKILVDDNPQRKAEVLATIDEAFKMMEKGKGTDEIIETFKNTTRTKQASGGLTSMLGE